MNLSLLLLLLGLKLRASALFSAAFRKRLRNESFVIVIRAAEEGPARTFRIRGGRIRTRSGRDPSADTELVWCDPKTEQRKGLPSTRTRRSPATGSRLPTRTFEAVTGCG